MSHGEQIREKIPVQTKFGNCILYFTNFVVTLESVTKGLVLELDHESVLSFHPVDKKSLKLTWSENNSIYEMIINYEKSDDIANKFKEIQNDHMDSLRIAGIKIKEKMPKQVEMKKIRVH
ncbi:hypothetical protein [Candidatus Nitrosotenuis sp. DW1]|uniref:hypothetical protein n=1 Tax=Candidatus Nitrosotenuis sp. DW1 TaxID=2259672 RepID=UPI0015C81F44|nr:hypothetical protein [Candidatus Nitrosotenuis sp. DW1]QLH09296.1 hypothetical protein DSQ19_07265 [Candidatus Nitrosotenuis sp. DW1]